MDAFTGRTVMTAAVVPTLVARLWPRTVTNSVPRALVLVLAGSVLLAASAHAKVPFWPVPMTMQTLVVLILGAGYGWRLGAATLIAYLVEGAAGLPVFTGGAGPAYMMGPTGGYLAGFVLAAALAGWFAERGFTRSVLLGLAAFLVADALVFALGVGWLSTLIGSGKAIAGGLVPFLPAEGLKIALATVITLGASQTAKSKR
jgi:biotin transport system substrate-specific component